MSFKTTKTIIAGLMVMGIFVGEIISFAALSMAFLAWDFVVMRPNRTMRELVIIRLQNGNPNN